MHILIAPNAFKNSLDATDVAKAIGEGLLQSALDCTVNYFPIADGGDGTAALIIQQHNGIYIKANVHDAIGRKIETSFGWIEEQQTAVIELANASGIRLLKPNEVAPLRASTFGVGELLKEALDKGAKKILMGIGGSATVDGGTGILQALGFRFLNIQNEEINNLPEGLGDLASIDVSGFDKRILSTELIILCDVENYLLGENGSAKIFGPQKGASPQEVEQLEKALTKLRDVTMLSTGKDMNTIKHGGASGGVAAGLEVFCNAQLVNGIDYLLTINNFDEALQNANLVITGEGSIDYQTLDGKGPYGVALRAKKKNIPVIGIAGKVPLEKDAELEKYFDALISINNSATDINTAIKNTKENLIRTGCVVGNLLRIGR